ncbi:MAG: ribosomal L7Ae/L30e/S12e/Gadd45 family protein [Bacteroidota bacterium]
MQQGLRDPKRRVVGLKQTLRALQQDRLAAVYLADDIDEPLRRKIQSACAEREVEIRPAGLSQRELGTLCQIEVGAAVVGILKTEG